MPLPTLDELIAAIDCDGRVHLAYDGIDLDLFDRRTSGEEHVAFENVDDFIAGLEGIYEDLNVWVAK